MVRIPGGCFTRGVQAGFERIEYDVPGLGESDVDPDPVRQFAAWFEDAADLMESNVMVLATATSNGRPSARAVLLKGFDERGFVFFTNHSSRKARELEENPWAEACLVWQPLHRQVRIAGRAARIDRAESDAYWATRPRDAQLASLASRQSSVLDTRMTLHSRIAAVEAAWTGHDEIPRPEYWGGWRIHPDSIEFWQGQSSRAHDRLRYRRAGPEWTVERLSP